MALSLSASVIASGLSLKLPVRGSAAFPLLFVGAGDRYRAQPTVLSTCVSCHVCASLVALQIYYPSLHPRPLPLTLETSFFTCCLSGIALYLKVNRKHSKHIIEENRGGPFLLVARTAACSRAVVLYEAAALRPRKPGLVARGMSIILAPWRLKQEYRKF